MAKKAPAGSRAALGQVHRLVSELGTDRAAKALGLSTRTVQRYENAYTQRKAGRAIRSEAGLEELERRLQFKRAQRVLSPPPRKTAEPGPARAPENLGAVLPRGSRELSPGVWETPRGAIVYSGPGALRDEYPSSWRYGREFTEIEDVENWLELGEGPDREIPLADYFKVVARVDSSGLVYFSIWDRRPVDESKGRKRTGRHTRKHSGPHKPGYKRPNPPRRKVYYK